MTHFVNPGMLETLAAGENILSASQHEKVARHYGVSSVYLSKEVASQIDDGTLTWKQFGGTHPGPVGNQLANQLLEDLQGMEGFERYQWAMPNPKVEKNNTATFVISGEPKNAGTDS